MYDIRVRNLILANIKADLWTRIGGFDKKAEVESSDPCAVVEDDSYVNELQQELKRTILCQILAGLDATTMDHTLEEAANTQLMVTVMETGSENDEGSATEVEENPCWQALQVRFSATLG